MSVALVLAGALLLGAPAFDPTTPFDAVGAISCRPSDGGFEYAAWLDRYRFVVSTDARGVPLRIRRFQDLCTAPPEPNSTLRCDKPASAEAQALWARAEPVVPVKPGATVNDECARESWGWETGNPTPYVEEAMSPGNRERFEAGTLKLELRTEAADGDVRGCKTLQLFVVMNGVKALAAEDRCRPGDERFAEAIQWSAENAVAASGDHVALALQAERYAPGSNVANVRRGRMVVVDRRTVATVDLLDAGAGAAADTLATQVAAAGFTVAHRGPAQTPRTATVIYCAKGFEGEARELAKRLGLAPGAVEPLTWKSAYAITVAAGGR